MEQGSKGLKNAVHQIQWEALWETQGFDLEQDGGPDNAQFLADIRLNFSGWHSAEIEKNTPQIEPRWQIVYINVSVGDIIRTVTCIGAPICSFNQAMVAWCGCIPGVFKTHRVCRSRSVSRYDHKMAT